MKNYEVMLTARIPETLRDLINNYAKRQIHLSRSEFIRAAIREKLLREAPELLNHPMKEAQ